MIGLDPVSGRWHDHRGLRVPTFGDGEPYPVELDPGETPPEAVTLRDNGNENTYYLGESGLTYCVKDYP